MSSGGVKQEMAIPLSDADIKDYLPDALIIKYSELSKYPTLHDVLPDVKSYCFILYEDSLNSGHWTVISRPTEDTAEYFDSYGGYVDVPLRWTGKEKRVLLGEGKPYLSIMFKECPEEVVYNKIHYQKEGSGINDCGRHCVLRTLKMLDGMNLNEYYHFMNKERRRLRMDYDGVVTTLIE
jgi:hypothetical protein